MIECQDRFIVDTHENGSFTLFKGGRKATFYFNSLSEAKKRFNKVAI